MRRGELERPDRGRERAAAVRRTEAERQSPSRRPLEHPLLLRPRRGPAWRRRVRSDPARSWRGLGGRMTSPLRVVIGTAGHVDHGKTALVKALTGIDTDRLPEEKRRGITLEAGYANLALPGVGTAGVVDVPGHERFLRAMVGAAGGIDVAVLCVAADEGPMPQTAEHLDVLRLLGVQAGVIAMTKADLLPELGPDHLELLTLELRDLVQGTFLEEAPIVEVSARTGKGLPELISAIAAAVKARQAAPRPEQAALFLPLDRAFAVKGFGTVVTGTLFSGALAVGDEVDLAGAGAKARGVRVRGVQVHGAPVDKARAGQRTAANLAGIEVHEAPRGAALVQAGTLESVGAAQVLDVEIELLPWAARPLRDRARLLAHIGTAQVSCVVALVDRAQLAPGERGLGQLRLSQPTAAIAGLRFLLRGALPKPGRDEAALPAKKLTRAARAHASTLGGGRILAVAARRRRRREADVAALQALSGEDPLAQADRILLESGYPGATPQRLAAGGAFTVKSAEKTLERLAQAGRAILFDREELRQRAGAPPQKLFAKALASLAERGEVRADAERVHPPGAPARLSGKDADAQEKLAVVLEGAGLSPPRTDEEVRDSPARVLRPREAHAAHRRQARAAQGGPVIGLELQRFLEVLPVPAMVMIGRRVISANRRMGALLGVTPEELLATADPVLRFVSPDDQPQVLGRIAARARGEPVAEEMDQAVIAANGQRIPVRAHVTPFAAVDPNAIMLVMTYERLRERHAELVRGFVAVAVAAQRERTQAGILRVAREQLQRLGLSVTLCELGAGRFRILEAGAGNPFISTLQRTWPGWIPDSVFPMARASTEGLLIEDLPGVMAKALGRPREEFIAAPPLAMVASIPIDGVAGYLFSCSGNDLDRTVASAFGLLGKQLGGALEMVGRLEELDRRNTELRIQAEEVALLNDVAQRLAGSFEVRPLLELGGETLRRLLDADPWCMLLPVPREPALRFHAGFPDQVGLGQQDEAVAMSAFRERRVVQVLDPPLGAG